MPDGQQTTQALFAEVLGTLKAATAESAALRAQLTEHASREEEVGQRIETSQREVGAKVDALISSLESLSAELRLHRERDAQEATQRTEQAKISAQLTRDRWAVVGKVASIAVPTLLALITGAAVRYGCVDPTAVTAIPEPAHAKDPGSEDATASVSGP